MARSIVSDRPQQGCALWRVACISAFLFRRFSELNSESHEQRRQFGIGIFFAALGAVGQGGGVVLSRKAYELCRVAGQPMDGVTAAYQRILGGVILSGLALLIVKREFLFTRATPSGESELSTREKWRRCWKWIAFNAVAGPALGVSCYQWALKTTPSAVVLPIVALSPLVVMPFARWLEQERPSRRSTLGAPRASSGRIADVCGSEGRGGRH